MPPIASSPPSTISEISLSAALHQASPRFTYRPAPLLSILIYSMVLSLWVLLFAAAWLFKGVFAWSVGLVYIAYDTWLLLYVARKTYFILHERVSAEHVERGLGQSDRPSLGVLIAARNEATVLPRTLDALLAQTDPAECVFVIDDGSDDQTAECLAIRYAVEWPGAGALGQSRHYPTLRVLRRAHSGKARALNAALTVVQTDIIVTVDADTVLAPDALHGMREAFAAEHELAAACGVIRPVCMPGFTSPFFQWFQTYEYMRAFVSRIAWMRSDTLLLVSGALAGFRRTSLLAVGGFDPLCLVEDYELIHRLHRYAYEHALCWRVRVISTARGTTDAPATLGAFLRQRRRWFAGFLQTQYWNRDMTGNRRYGPLGRWMLPIKAVDTLQPVFGLTAIVLLLVFLATGRLRILVPVLIVIGAKILVDMGFHLWWLRVYGHWTGARVRRGGLGLALLASLAEPFSFQLMRHVGAVWGWFSFLSGQYSWSISRRHR